MFFEKWVKPLKKISNFIYITNDTPTIEKICQDGRDECKEIIYSFPLIVDSKSTLKISVKSLNCVFTYNGSIIQNLFWKSNDVFASNGTEMHSVVIESLEKENIVCKFKPFPYLPSPPEFNQKWGIKGIIGFDCFYGSFEKEFNFIDLSVERPDDWIKIISEYQHLYSSILSKKALVIG